KAFPEEDDGFFILDDLPYAEVPLPFRLSESDCGGVPRFHSVWQDEDHLELAHLGETGRLHWAALRLTGAERGRVARLIRSRGRSARAASFLSPGRLAAVSASGVHWLRAGETGLHETGFTRCGLDDAVACFGSPLTSELLVLTRQGELVRVPM